MVNWRRKWWSTKTPINIDVLHWFEIMLWNQNQTGTWTKLNRRCEFQSGQDFVAINSSWFGNPNSLFPRILSDCRLNFSRKLPDFQKCLVRWKSHFLLLRDCRLHHFRVCQKSNIIRIPFGFTFLGCLHHFFLQEQTWAPYTYVLRFASVACI